MADILVRMEMPESCSDCPMCYDQMECTVRPIRFWNEELMDFCNERHPDCPLVELPEHGDLIDRVAFRVEMDKHYPFDRGTQRRHGEADAAKSTVINMLANAPVVIPSSKEYTE